MKNQPTQPPFPPKPYNFFIQEIFPKIELFDFDTDDISVEEIEKEIDKKCENQKKTEKLYVNLLNKRKEKMRLKLQSTIKQLYAENCILKKENDELKQQSKELFEVKQKLRNAEDNEAHLTAVINDLRQRIDNAQEEERIRDDMEKCPTCQRFYNNTNRKPKSLPCGHLLCSSCYAIEIDMNGLDAKCHICRKPIFGEPIDLKFNYFI